MKAKITSLALLILMVLQLIACASKTNDTPETEDATVREVVLNSAGAEYKIIRSKDADDEVIDIASYFRRSLSDMLGDRNAIEQSKDWLLYGESADNDNFEILVGITNRPESEAESEALSGYLDFSVTVRDNKICVFANTPERLKVAVEYFLQNTVVEDGKLIYKGGSISDVFPYPLSNLTFAGSPVSEYRIIIAKDAPDAEIKLAEEIRVHIAEVSGAWLEISDDSSPETEKEFVIGKTNRSDEKTEGYKIVSMGKKIMLVAEKSAYYYAARNLFFDTLEKDGCIAGGITVENSDSAYDFFLKDNYASGLIGDEVNVGVQAMLSCLEYFNDRMVYGSEKLGERWVYSNSGKYAAQTGYFDTMLKSSKKGGNCASPVNWALCEMGIVPKNDRFYGGSSGEFKSYSGNAETYLAPYCDYFDYSKNPVSFKELYKSGKVKAGDIFLCKHHTFVYRGDETFYAAGHDGAWHTEADAPTEDERKAVFDNWVLAFDEVSGSGEKKSGSYNSNYNYKVYYIVRLKDSYIPAFYRNKEGKLVENPMAAK